MKAKPETAAAMPGSVQRLVGRFAPSLREIRDGVWVASIRLPVVGEVSVEANSWPEAKLSLWLTAQALEAFSRKQCKPPSEWTEDEWSRVLGTMRDVTSPNDKAEPHGGKEP